VTRLTQKAREGAIHVLLWACAALSLAITLAIAVVLVSEALHFFRVVSLGHFLSGTNWSPQLEPRAYGVWPLICGTLLVAVLALAVAIPTGLATAIFMSEYAPGWLRQTLKPVLELLAGVPSVVYGFFALTFITPYVIKPLLPAAEIFNALSAAIVVGIMIIPTIASLCDDAFRAVPRALRDGAYALAATRFEVALRVVFPSALSGVFAAVLLALARAIGETMAVAIAAGLMPRMTLDPRQSVQTMTGYIVQISSGDTPHGSLEYYSIFAVGLTLFLITLAVNVVANRVLRRFREVYE
jgi:phosphate transport system permease protein